VVFGEALKIKQVEGKRREKVEKYKKAREDREDIG